MRSLVRNLPKNIKKRLSNPAHVLTAAMDEGSTPKSPQSEAQSPTAEQLASWASLSQAIKKCRQTSGGATRQCELRQAGKLAQ
jgi:hypothetical protein